MENTLKINVFLKSILFCKYLHNGSSYPYEILYGCQKNYFCKKYVWKSNITGPEFPYRKKNFLIILRGPINFSSNFSIKYCLASLSEF